MISEQVQAMRSKTVIKKELRSIKRLLTRDGLDETIRSQKSKTLASLEKELARVEEKVDGIAVRRKYKSVMFVERRKVNRKIEQLRKTLESCVDKDERQKVRKDLERAEADLDYIRYFPEGEKYVSLFPKPERQTEEYKAKQDELREKVRQRKDDQGAESEEECDKDEINTKQVDDEFFMDSL